MHLKWAGLYALGFPLVFYYLRSSYHYYVWYYLSLVGTLIGGYLAKKI